MLNGHCIYRFKFGDLVHTCTFMGIDLTDVTLYCSSIFIMQVENPSQQADASIDALYSLVISVKSSPPTHEVYIDAHFRNTALKVN